MDANKYLLVAAIFAGLFAALRAWACAQMGTEMAE
jgi:hypothetical protein